MHVPRDPGKGLAAGLGCRMQQAAGKALAAHSRIFPHLATQLAKLLRHRADQEATWYVSQHVLGVGLGLVGLLVQQGGVAWLRADLRRGGCGHGGCAALGRRGRCWRHVLPYMARAPAWQRFAQRRDAVLSVHVLACKCLQLAMC